MASFAENRQTLRRRDFVLGTMAAASLGGSFTWAQEPAPAPVTDKLDEAVKKLAVDISDYLKADRDAGNQVSVAKFAASNGTVNARIGTLLGEQLRGAGLSVVEKDAYTVSGRIDSGKLPNGQFVTRITAMIHNKNGSQKHQLPIEIKDKLEGIQSLGATVPAVKTETELEKKLAKAVTRPNVFISENAIQASPDSPYKLEIAVWDGSKYVPIQVNKIEGLAHCAIPPTSEFAVKLFNPTDAPVIVDLSLDGINMFAFSQNPNYKKLGKVLIFPKTASLIKGWHDLGPKSHSFLVTKYGDSAAARLGVTGASLGTITATFFQAIKTRDGEVSQDALGVGFGTARETPYKDVFFNAGAIQGAVSIKYDRPADLPPVG